MKTITTTVLLGCGVMLLAASVQAHQIWFEPSQHKLLALYYGEYDKNMLEVTPGGMDRFKALQVWSRRGVQQPLTLTLQRDHFTIEQSPAVQDTLLAADAYYPIFDLHEQGKTLKAYWTPATRWVGDLRARSPELDLDIVPTGVIDGGKAQFQVFFLNKPLAQKTVALETASGEVINQTSDADGKVSFEMPWQGTYVVAAEHKVYTAGERTSPQKQLEPYDVRSFSSTLSFYQPGGKTPLPRAPSQLPASEIARLKKAAG
jgi:uncharacterized GH25 family protein